MQCLGDYDYDREIVGCIRMYRESAVQPLLQLTKTRLCAAGSWLLCHLQQIERITDLVS